MATRSRTACAAGTRTNTSLTARANPGVPAWHPAAQHQHQVHVTGVAARLDQGVPRHRGLQHHP
jgi:hypothetical protein